MRRKSVEVIKALLELGVMATVNEVLDATAPGSSRTGSTSTSRSGRSKGRSSRRKRRIRASAAAAPW
jgi:hypothetical protein